MATPIWTVGATNLGTIKHGIEFEKQVTAIYAVDYEIVNGALPLGAEIDSTGKIFGLCYEQSYNSNTPVQVYTFTVRAISDNGDYADRVFKISLLSQELLVPASIDQNLVKYQEQSFVYQITRGVVNTDINQYWRLDLGNLPDGVSLYQNGAIEGLTGTFIKPFALSTFLKPGVSVVPETLISSWDSWAKSYLSSVGQNDHQFTLSLHNGIDPIHFSVTGRIVYINLDSDISWFSDNDEYVELDSTLTFVFVTVTDKDYLTWKTDASLPDLSNGEISELDVKATSEADKKVTYALKPKKASRLPLGLFFLEKGLIAGRVSFRCHVDDPDNLPVNDDYYFIVRAKTADNFSFIEREFKLHIERTHPSPYVNIWIRSFPDASNRAKLDEILSNKVFFPDSLLYRDGDPWFGKSNELRMLLAPGLKPATIEEFYQAIVNNHYTKELLFGEVTNAYAYDNNLNLVYEVVYLPVVDNFGKLNPVTNRMAGLPDVIDLRNNIKNYYWDKNGAVYYNFTPNGLDNMRRQFEQTVGYYNQGILPRWMLSPQPVPSKSGQFYPPKGYQYGIILAYTRPKGSDIIVYRLKRAGINFNDFRFEFDRLELDDNLMSTYDPTAKNFVGSDETIFDNELTIFEEGTTRFNRSSDFVGGQGPGVGNKYLKFPRTGAFY